VISPEEAWERLLPHLRPLPPTPRPRRRARGQVLAAPVAATLDLPAADVSAMDGYAVDGEPAAGEERKVVGRVAAGDPPGARLPPGGAIRIMTGAPLPAGADRVVPLEATAATGPTDGRGERVRFREGVAAGAHVRRRGEIHRAGDALLAAGALLTPGALALLAAHGHREVLVHRPPRIAILTTGDEVVPPDSEPRPGQLRDSHTDFLLAAGRSVGLEATSLGIAPDDEEGLLRLVHEGLGSDVLLLTGGVSAGELDLVEGALARLGCEVLFDAVAIQPGKPLVAARHPGGLIFGLPGNPASVMVAFWLFVRPALRRLLGASDGFWAGALRGRLAAPLPPAKARDRFLPAEVAFAEEELVVTPVLPVGSHDLAAYARGTALVRVRAGPPTAPPGAACELLPLADWRGEAGARPGPAAGGR